MIEVRGLTVRFAGVTPIDDVSVVFPGGVRAHRPERGRQDDVLQRPERLRPAGEGCDQLLRDDLLAMADFRRARWGLRRTFQTEQAIEGLSCSTTSR